MFREFTKRLNSWSISSSNGSWKSKTVTKSCNSLGIVKSDPMIMIVFRL
jgi:hypothetical protein